MRLIDAPAIAAALDWPALIEALQQAFARGAEVPVRHHHRVEVPGEPDATLLLMPAWTPGEYIGVKLVGVFPGNAERGLPAVAGQYLLLDGRTGATLALLDGAELTARRTAAASALAARFLARPDARRLLLVSTGRLSEGLACAHASVRRYQRIGVWGRHPDKAEAVAARLREAHGLPAAAVIDLEAEARAADVISCATLSREPLIRGGWLAPGAHLDLVGGFTPEMREADDEAVRRAAVFVDTRAGAAKEAGDIVQPLAAGVLAAEDIRAELAELCRGAHPGRSSDAQITLFKSVGTALEDLAAAALAWQRL